MIAHNLGFPRIGPHREMKKAVEDYWAGRMDEAGLAAAGRAIRSAMWRAQAGLDLVPVGDFTWYDHVLDTTAMFGAIPDRFGPLDGDVDLDTIFRMARGRAPTGPDVPALEMTKWFDTNYHYLVPEFLPDQQFRLSSRRLFDEVREALDLGVPAKPVVLGPLTFLWLGKEVGRWDAGRSRLDLAGRLLPLYAEVLSRLSRMGVSWVQVDEPILVLDLPGDWQRAFRKTYEFLSGNHPRPRILVATFYGGLEDNLGTAASLPAEGLHVDLVRAPGQMDAVLEAWPRDRVLSVGVVDGRNVWRADLDAVLDRLAPALSRESVWVAPSCPLWHVPVDLSTEADLDAEVRSWLAFAVQKVREVQAIRLAVTRGRESAAEDLNASREAARSRRESPGLHRPDVRDRLGRVDETWTRRPSPFPQRRATQGERLGLPLFPTTTIGSFPQTREIRAARTDLRAGRISREAYDELMREEIRRCIAFQEQVGLDVLVHGEPERADMVEYFGERLDGFVFTKNGWVQSYGSRCVKPPVIVGDVARPRPMTVEWATFAQSLTSRPVKGMLTGPLTMLQWSFVRDDQPRETTAMQIALAIRDEVSDLVRAGIRVIQIDEPAFREGLPLRGRDRDAYLDWAVRAFRVASTGVPDSVQVHTHMCYAEFNDFITAIAALDADVISVEASRSGMALLGAFEDFEYPNDIGPGIYDVHSPRVPQTGEMVALLRKAATRIPAARLWVNPDCGLKTRGWPEVRDALRNLVEAARVMRREYGGGTPEK